MPSHSPKIGVIGDLTPKTGCSRPIKATPRAHPFAKTRRMTHIV